MLLRVLQSKFAVAREDAPTLETILLLFFCWGVLLSLNDLLSVTMRARLHLSYRSALLLQCSYFLVSFVSAPWVSRVLERHGYRRSILVGLCLMSAGCALMAGGTAVTLWAGCLAASAVMGLGINLMQTAAGPMVAHLGQPELGARRFGFALAFNSLGTTAGPLLGARWLQGEASLRNGSVNVSWSYAALAMALLGILWLASRLPHWQLPEERAAHSVGGREPWLGVLRRPTLLFGALAMFLYVGAEIGIGGLLVPFGREAGIDSVRAARMLSLYWGGAMVGRFLFVPLLRRPRDLSVLLMAACASLALVLTASLWQDPRAVWVLLPVGLCHAVMVPVLYDRSLAGLGGLTPRGAAVMSSMGIGGAVLPQVLGWTSDRSNVHHAFLLLAVPYLAVAAYAVWYARWLSTE